MSALHDPDAVARYAAAVRAALADLRAEERAQLLDDLEAHLQEVAAESDASLSERLGPPEAYAEELRAAYGAPPRPAGRAAAAASGPARPRRWRRWRLPAGILALALVLGVAGLVARQVSHSNGGGQWSESQLRSEVAADHVRQVVITGHTGTATDAGGVQHTVALPDTTASLAGELTSHGVAVSYQQSSTFPLWFLVVDLLFLGAPLAFVVVLAWLVLGILWRLYRRLGRPTGIM